MSRINCDRPCEHNTLASLLKTNHGFLTINSDTIHTILHAIEQMPDPENIALKEDVINELNNLIGGADADSDTLKELADKITALAQADNDLVSAAQAQSFSSKQKKQARDNIDAASKSDIPDISGLATKEDIANLQLGLTEEQVRAIIEEYHPPKPKDQGLAKDYPGTGWYKAIDTGIVYNKDVPEGETHVFSDGDTTEYISVWKHGGFDPNTFSDSVEDYQKLVDWHKNLHRYATSNVTDMSYWAYAYGNDSVYEDFGDLPEEVNLSHYDTSNVTSMNRMFIAAANFNQPINFNTSKVKDMSNMFEGARAFNQPLPIDTSSVEYMTEMFYGASSFNQDLSHLCVSKIVKEPLAFSEDATAWTKPKPVWGTCPRGEDQA